MIKLNIIYVNVTGVRVSSPLEILNEQLSKVHSNIMLDELKARGFVQAAQYELSAGGQEPNPLWKGILIHHCVHSFIQSH